MDNTAIEIVKKSRMVSRPTTLEFIQNIFTYTIIQHITK